MISERSPCDSTSGGPLGSGARGAYQSGRRSPRSLLLMLKVSLALAVMSIVGLGRDEADATSQPPLFEVAVIQSSPQWPFQGIFEPAAGHFWDTVHNRFHDVGGETRLGDCLEDYVLIDESGIALGYTSYAAWPRSKHYMIPWGDIAYPVIGSGVALRQDVAPSMTASGLEHRELNAVTDIDIASTTAVSHGNEEDGGDYRWLVGFQVANSAERRWYRPYGSEGGFVEHPAGAVSVEEFAALLEQSAFPEHPRHYRDAFISSTDGHYYGITLYFAGHAACHDVSHTFVVDGATGAVVACHAQEWIQGATRQGAASLVFVAPDDSATLTKFELPDAVSPIGLGNCPARIDDEPSSLFAGFETSSDRRE